MRVSARSRRKLVAAVLSFQSTSVGGVGVWPPLSKRTGWLAQIGLQRANHRSSRKKPTRQVFVFLRALFGVVKQAFFIARPLFAVANGSLPARLPARLPPALQLLALQRKKREKRKKKGRETSAGRGGCGGAYEWPSPLTAEASADDP